MAKIVRCTQKVFAGSVTATGNNAVFGSLISNYPGIFSNDPATIMSLPAWGEGWPSATVGNQSPARQDFSGYQLVVTSQLAYILQEGIAEYDAATVYYTNSIAKSGSTIYRSLTDNNTGNAVTDTSNWAVYLTDGGASKAWGSFDGSGSSGAITPIVSSGVASIVKNSSGNYTVTTISSYSLKAIQVSIGFNSLSSVNNNATHFVLPVSGTQFTIRVIEPQADAGLNPNFISFDLKA